MVDKGFAGSIAQHYDDGLASFIFDDIAADLARRVAVSAPQRVLETAAGTGLLTRALRHALPAGAELTATDISPPMLDLARLRLGGADVDFVIADATDLPFADASFDALACQLGVMFFPDKAQSFAEAKRVLRRGGLYFLNVWDGHKYNPFGRISHAVVESFFPIDPPQFQRIPFFYPFEAIKDALLDAGFLEITGTIVRADKALPDVARLARGIVYGSPLIEQIRSRGTVPAEIILAAMTTAFASEFASGSMPLQALVMSARA